MQKIFISSFCVLFEDYDLLEQLCKSCPEVPMGAELGTSWPIPNFDCWTVRCRALPAAP